MDTVTTDHLTALDCPTSLHPDLQSAGLPVRVLADMDAHATSTGAKINFPAFIAFLRKYSPIVPAIFAAYSSGGWLGVLIYAGTVVQQYPDLLKDFLAIFA